MKKSKFVGFKITGLDLEYLRHQAKKLDVTLSEVLRRLIEQSKEKAKNANH